MTCHEQLSVFWVGLAVHAVATACFSVYFYGVTGGAGFVKQPDLARFGPGVRPMLIGLQLTLVIAMAFAWPVGVVGVFLLRRVIARLHITERHDDEPGP